MDFTFSTEQKLLQDSVERFVQEAYQFEIRRKLVASDDGFSRDIWAKFADLGWLGMPLPEAYGGLDGTPVETMIVMEAFGRGLVAEPYIPTVVLGAGLVLAAGSEQQKQAILPAVANGEMMLAFAFAEPQSRFNLADIETTAEPADGGWLLEGRKSVVIGAPSADKIVLSARTGGASRDADGVSLFLLDADAAGLARRDYGTVDGLRASDLTLDGVKVGADALLGEAGQALAAIEEVADRAIAALCAEAVGGMQVLLDTTNEYLKTRKQFGVPIGKFQVLQHRMVDMFIEVEQSRSMTYMVTLKLDEPADERKKAASGAKVQIGKGGKFVGAQAIQLHGGMGMTDELSVSHYYKRLLMIETLFGNTDHHLKRFASLTQ